MHQQFLMLCMNFVSGDLNKDSLENTIPELKFTFTLYCMWALALSYRYVTYSALKLTINSSPWLTLLRTAVPGII